MSVVKNFSREPKGPLYNNSLISIEYFLCAKHWAKHSTWKILSNSHKFPMRYMTLHFTDEQTELWRGEVTCPGHIAGERQRQGFNLGLCDGRASPDIIRRLRGETGVGRRKTEDAAWLGNSTDLWASESDGRCYLALSSSLILSMLLSIPQSEVWGV